MDSRGRSRPRHRSANVDSRRRAQGAQDFGTQIAVSGGENRVAAALARSNAGKIDAQATVDQVGGYNMRELGIVR